MFKIGEKVVYIGGDKNDIFNRPKQNEIVTIDGIDIDGDYSCVGYRYSKRGIPQYFNEKELRRIDYEFAENVLSNIVKEVKKEELVRLN